MNKSRRHSGDNLSCLGSGPGYGIVRHIYHWLALQGLSYDVMRKGEVQSWSCGLLSARCWAWTGQSHHWGFPNSPSHSNAPQENLIRRRDRRKITSVIVQMGIVCFSPFYSRNMTSCKCSSFKGIFLKVVAPGIPQAIWSSGELKRQRH